MILGLLLGPAGALKSEANLKVKSEASLKAKSGANLKAKSQVNLKVTSEANLKLKSQASLKVESGVKMRLRFDAADAKKNRPVRKVINLLKDMKVALAEEVEKDEEVYHKMSCWCDLNEKRLLKQIQDADSTVQDTISEIEVLTALIAELMVRIKHLKADIAKWNKEIDEAHTLRRKQKAEFHVEEVDLMESTAALRSAVIVMEKHYQGSLLQMPHERVHTIAAAMQRGMDKHEPLLKGVLKDSDREVISSLIQMSTKRRTVRGQGKQSPSYKTGSGEIYGILTTMHETFDTNLKSAQAEDAANEQAYRDLREAKEKQIKEGSEDLARKKEELFNAKMRIEELKALIPKTKENKEKDDTFLDEMRERCAIIEREWPVRQKTRALEKEAITETIEMLTTEESHELFSRTFNPSLLQEKSMTNSKARVRSTANAKVRVRASRLLSAVAAKTHNPRIAMIAVSVRLDTFKRVKESIDKMIAALLNQKAEETSVLEDCKRLMKKNEETAAAKQFEKKEVSDKIDELGVVIKKLTEDIQLNKKEIADLQAALAEAIKERAEENAEYKQVVMDQTATQELLKKALGVLHNFYDKNLLPEIPKLVQTQYFPKVDPARSMPEDFGFDVYGKQTEVKKDGGVFQMIEQIIYDSEQTVKAAEREERNGVEALKQLKFDTNKAISPRLQNIIEFKEKKADREIELGQAEQLMEDTVLEIDQLTNEAKHIDKECGFLFKNYETDRKSVV